MEIESIKARIKELQSTIPENFNLTFKENADGTELNFSHPISVIEFAQFEFKQWENSPELPTIRMESMDFFKSIIDGTNSITIRLSQNVSNTNYWNELNQLFINKRMTVFRQSQEIVQILYKLLEVDNDIFHGALNFIVKEDRRSKQRQQGEALAVSYFIESNPKVPHPKADDKKTMTVKYEAFENWKIQEAEKFNKLTNEKEKRVNQLLDDLELQFKETQTKFDQWFNVETRKSYTEWFQESQSKLTHLTDTYEKSLALSKPADYWAERGKKLTKQGNIAMGIAIVLVLVTCAFLAYILIKAPDAIFTDWFQSSYSKAVRWSILFVTFVSFLAFVLRALIKFMFSSFHLARDCQERYTLTYFFLSISNNAEIKEEERKLIIQSLFSRADTGLLKEDGGPTMPQMFNRPN